MVRAPFFKEEQDMNAQEIKETSKKYVLQSWSKQAGLNPIVIDHAEGIYMYDAEGNRYTDMSSQLVNLNVGFGNKAIGDAIKAQVDKFCFVGPAYGAESRATLGKMIIDLLPDNFGKVFFTNAGADANENAVKIARMYTGRNKVFSRYRSYHGSSFGAGNLTGEPTDVMIKAEVSVFLQKGCDYCIGFGGGSPLDAAKAIAVMAANEGNISDFNGKEITKMAGSVVAIPTTAGTGSEATKFTVITDSVNDIKMLLKGDCLIPKIAIVDETFSLSSPQSVTAATGLDALTHAVVAYTSRKAMDMTDTLAVSAVKRIMKYLPVAYRDGKNREARHQMALAALEAGICINNSSVTLVHGLSRPIGALFHVAHGISNAMLLKACFSFALKGAYERFADLGRELVWPMRNRAISRQQSCF